MKSVYFKSISLIALLIIWIINDLPLPIMGGIGGSIIVAYDLITMFKGLSMVSRVGFIGLIAAFITITVLFYYKYYITDISITIYQIIGLIMPPIFAIGFGRQAKQRK